MSKKLLILSDMHGYVKDTLPRYMQYSIDGYQCQHYDVSRLANIDINQNNLHSNYIDFGIDTAVNKLLEFETEKVSIIAFSIGGAIAWKAALKGLKIEHLIAVSSTRLRFEKEKPNCDLTLLFAEYDEYKPDMNWFENHSLQYLIEKGQHHEMYKEDEIRKKLIKILSKRH